MKKQKDKIEKEFTCVLFFFCQNFHHSKCFLVPTIKILLTFCYHSCASLVGLQKSLYPLPTAKFSDQKVGGFCFVSRTGNTSLYPLKDTLQVFPIGSNQAVYSMYDLVASPKNVLQTEPEKFLKQTLSWLD